MTGRDNWSITSSTHHRASLANSEWHLVVNNIGLKFLQDVAHLELRCYTDANILIKRKNHRTHALNRNFAVVFDTSLAILTWCYHHHFVPGFCEPTRQILAKCRDAINNRRVQIGRNQNFHIVSIIPARGEEFSYNT